MTASYKSNLHSRANYLALFTKHRRGGYFSLDAIGALLIAWLAFKEGRELFEKARGLNSSCGCTKD